MRRMIIPLAVLAVLGLGIQAHAASALDLLYKDSVTINHLEDNDWESIVQNDVGNVTLDIGDYLIGMFEIQMVRDVVPGLKPDKTPTTNTFTGVFLVEAATKVFSFIGPNGNNVYKYTFKPAPVAAWAPLGLPAPTALGGGTMGIVYDDSSSPFVDPNPVGPPGRGPALATATDGIELWEIGFAGAPLERWEALSPDAINTDINLLQFNAALNVTEAAPGTPKLLLHNFVYNGITVTPSIFSQWQLTGRFETPGVNDIARFQTKTDTDLYIRPVPEPGSLALLGLGLAAFGGVVYRRRRKV